MSEAAQLHAEPAGPSGTTTASARAQHWRQPPGWLWGASVLAQVVCAAALTSYTFLFARTVTLRMPAHWPWEHHFLAALARLRAIPALT